MNVSGTVEDIIVREVEGKYGLTNAYDVVVDGKKYGHGFKEPAFHKGDAVSFEVDVVKRGKYTNYNIRYETVRQGPAEAARAAQGEDSGYDRNRSIVRQNSLAHATALVVALGVTDLEKATKAALEVAEKFEAYSMLDTPAFDE